MAGLGLVNADGSFTEAGRAQRTAIESATDRAALVAWQALTDDEALTLRGAGKTLSQLVIDAGLLIFNPAVLAED